MLIGDVTWSFNDGSTDSGGFAARALIEHKGSEKPKLKLYQGWAVRTSLTASLETFWLTILCRIFRI